MEENVETKPTVDIARPNDTSRLDVSTTPRPVASLVLHCGYCTKAL